MYCTPASVAVLLMSSCESMPTAFNMASMAMPVADPDGELLNSRRTFPSQPDALAAATNCFAAFGSYFAPGTFGYHLKSFCKNSEPGRPWPLLARWSTATGSMAAAIALRTLRSLVGGLAGVGPSGLPLQVGAGLPPVHCTSMPEFSRSTLPDWFGKTKAGALSVRADCTAAGARRTPALIVPLLK